MIRRLGLACLLALALWAPLRDPSTGWTGALSQVSRPSSWRMSNYDAQATRFNGTERVIGPANVARLHPVWRLSGVLQAVAIGRQVFAVVNSATSVAVVDALTGKVARTFSLASLHLRPDDRFNALAYADGKLIVASSLAVVAVDPRTGRQLWRMAGGATELVVGGRVIYTAKYCETACGAFAAHAIDLDTGQVLWRHPGNFSDLPVLVAGRLYQRWLTHGGETRVYDPQSGQSVATLPINALWTGDQHNTYAEVLPRLTSGAGTAARLSLVRVGPTGKPTWKADLGKAAGRPPVLAYNTLYVPSFRFHPGIVAINARNGKLLWGADIGKNVVLIGANHLIFALHADSSGRLDVLDAGSGRILRQLDIGRMGFRGADSLLIAGGALYLVSAGEGMLALRP